MRATIWKYELAVDDEQIIAMPMGAQVLSVQVQHGVPCLWVRCQPDAPTAPVRVITLGTGHPAEHVEDLQFVGTYQLLGGNFVGHVFVQPHW
jgi:hypothetical protein